MPIGLTSEVEGGSMQAVVDFLNTQAIEIIKAVAAIAALVWTIVQQFTKANK